MILKPFDVAIMLITLGIITLYFFDTISSGNNNRYVKIEVEGKEYIYPLDSDDIITFTGPIGNTKVQIHDEKAAIIESDCNNKTCIKIGEIHKSGQSSACLPNRVLVTIEGDNSSEVDVVSY